MNIVCFFIRLNGWKSKNFVQFFRDLPVEPIEGLAVDLVLRRTAFLPAPDDPITGVRFDDDLTLFGSMT